MNRAPETGLQIAVKGKKGRTTLLRIYVKLLQVPVSAELRHCARRHKRTGKYSDLLQPDETCLIRAFRYLPRTAV